MDRDRVLEAKTPHSLVAWPTLQAEVPVFYRHNEECWLNGNGRAERILPTNSQRKIAPADPSFASRWQMGFMSWFWPGLGRKLSLCQ